MKILLHVCCGPCAVFPLSILQKEGHQVEGYFFNPNIHPFKEFKRRLNALEQLSKQTNFSVDYIKQYGLKDFLRKVVFHEQERCAICYEMRLQETADKALEVKADSFSTTLLYSRYQNHSLIIKTAERIAQKTGVAFYYQDFRKGWQQGIDMSIEMDLYRQPYCGCIYSEQERYDKSLQKKKKPTTAKSHQ